MANAVDLVPSGITGSASFTPAAAGYSAGDIVDVAKEIGFSRVDGSSLAPGSLIRILTVIIKNGVAAVPSNQTSFTGQFYSIKPPTARADNDPWTLPVADLTAYRGSIALGTPVDLGTALYVKTQYVDTDIKLALDRASLYMELVTVGNPTLAATAIDVLLYGVAL